LRIKLHTEGLAIACEVGDRQGQSVHYRGLGHAYQSLGYVQRAIECCDKGVIIAREIGRRSQLNSVLAVQGLVKLLAGNVLEAHQRCETDTR
jgi:hypothetical protein